MSLINEALKKAEQARAGGLPEAPTAPSAPVIAKRSRAIGTRTLVLLGVVVVLLVVGGTTALFLRSGPEPVSAPRKEGVAKAKAAPAAKAATSESPELTANPPTQSAPNAVVSSGSTTAPAAVTSAPSVNPKAAAPITPPATNVPPPTAAPVVPTAPAAAANPIPAPTAPAAAVGSAHSPAPPSPSVSSPPANATPRPDEKIAEYLDRLRILGVRSPGPEARVLIGERVFRLNDVVDRGLGLRLQKVDPGKITFVDAAGMTYTKNY